MNKIRGRKGFFLASLLLLSGGVTAAVQAEESPDLEQLFYTYCQDNVIGRYFEEDYLTMNGIEQKRYNAFIALDQIDLDWNGEEELLAIRLKPVDENGVSRTSLMAEVYEYQGDRLQRVAQTELVQDALTENIVRTDVFLVITDQGPVLCCEDKQTASIMADGTDWKFTAVTYHPEGFTLYGQTELIGSYWEPEDESESWNLVNSLGLYPESLASEPITRQIDAVQPISLLNRYMLVDYDTINAFFQGTMGESLQYGETEFINCINPELETKLPNTFSQQVEYAQDPVGTENLSNDYVIRDSNERYLTEEDLNRLTEHEILLARNEIYARHGRIFRDEELDAYFRSKSWYEPTVSGDEFTNEYAASVFNEIEISNIGFIVDYENRLGLNQN